jgi:hypothetical protein
VRIDANSLYVFKAGTFVRNWAVRLIEWEWFDRFIMTIILLNSILLCLSDYDDRVYSEEYFSLRNHELDKIDVAFTIIFIFECVAKVIAKGFLFHRNAYLRDPWNWLDFFVVCISLLNFLPGIDSGGLKALRTFRILRPLRTINRFP